MADESETPCVAWSRADITQRADGDYDLKVVGKSVASGHEAAGDMVIKLNGETLWAYARSIVAELGCDVYVHMPEGCDPKIVCFKKGGADGRQEGAAKEEAGPVPRPDGAQDGGGSALV